MGFRWHRTLALLAGEPVPLPRYTASRTHTIRTPADDEPLPDDSGGDRGPDRGKAGNRRPPHAQNAAGTFGSLTE